MKPLVRLAKADSDVDAAIEYYLTEAPHVANTFIDALERAYRHIQRMPGAGSARYAWDLDLPDIRFVPCGKFPYLIFYQERPNAIAVIRVLHTQRDIPASLFPPN
jgi:Plasmid stabilization system protein